jgi:adenosylcobinamide kinase / adenosylcobinamide-phosphate guanylyltransferase
VSLVFLVGGARSGKSAIAVELARAWPGPVSIVVTGEPGDAEMAERIRLHRAARPRDWQTIEEPVGLRSVVESVPHGTALIVDCLSLWVANALARGETGAEVEEDARQTAAIATARRALTVAVSNEVGLGIVPTSALGRRYRDVLGRVNAAWAAVADEAALVVAGRVLRLESAAVLSL